MLNEKIKLTIRLIKNKASTVCIVSEKGSSHKNQEELASPPALRAGMRIPIFDNKFPLLRTKTQNRL